LTVIVNGEEKEISDGLSVSGLLNALDLKPERLAVELNRRIIRRAEWDSTTLADGDRLEIVNFVGGGLE
jgi:thiamine biosynthesis protein ThiS